MCKGAQGIDLASEFPRSQSDWSICGTYQNKCDLQRTLQGLELTLTLRGMNAGTLGVYFGVWHQGVGS